MTFKFKLSLPKLLIAIALMLVGIFSISLISRTGLILFNSNFTSIGLLVSGLIFYSGIIVIIMMFENEILLAITLLFPSIVAVAIFVYGFIGWSIRVSLSKWKGLNPDFTWVGLAQYRELFHDPRFLIDVRNTVMFTVLFIAGCLLIGLTLAILLDQRLKGEAIFRSLYLFPMSISFIAAGVVWGWLMNPATGDRTAGINLIFQKLGLTSLISLWHSTPQPWGMAFTVIPAVWMLSGYTMALYLGGMRAISDDLREAARVDGASEFDIYRYIVFPMLQPVTLSAVIILGHMSLKIFDLIVALGNKDIRLDVPGIYMWVTTFDGTNYAQGAAIGILMLISVAVLVVPYLVQSMRTETRL
ncbi:carbohydrate ABC transporter membrane protein 1, CUT1 family [Longilinea arvoryzae]|uniref:Carbohydrate ABC transporter membrane protein 1, CUT1 family n=1 Tax=Longilinea arvoryzae TaxID=360412 RepID=A0A0S7BID7_9CHLR|nr:sugar ABC transporter permease [Longilinea arvoryzae]GAP15517.1 carbohydrate ABC transporter membrane protein 1, CUT1 family [Longilinea arvoryzae]